MFTLLVKDQCSSYKDLPLTIYQIQTKYRDEARPRAGLLRGREFTMKDSYSFDVDDAGLERSYQVHRRAYVRIFERLGLDYAVVSAISGAMGGSRSEEFLCPLPVGEDTFARCDTCGYAANAEAVETLAPPPREPTGLPPAHVEDTPGTPTIDTLVAEANARFPRDDRPWAAADTLKNVLVTVSHPDGRREPLAVGLPGDRELDPDRLGAVLGEVEVAPFGDDDFARHPALVKGYIGPGALGEESASGIRYLLDPRVADGTAWVTGADEDGRHVFDLVAGRDFGADGTIEAAEVRDGDPCRCGGGRLRLGRGVEIGHIFQLGRRYAEALGLQVLDENGRLVTVTMGSYGIGLSRAVAAIAESHHDESGLCWPREVAPADVHLVAAGRDEAVTAFADRLADDLAAAGVRVLYDDRRRVSPGVKFADAELIGVPTIVVVGRNLAEGAVEVRDRATGGRRDVPADGAADHVARIVLGV
jgi:prolyl-tRNA synthetase